MHLSGDDDARRSTRRGEEDRNMCERPGLFPAGARSRDGDVPLAVGELLVRGPPDVGLEDRFGGALWAMRSF